MPIRIQRKRTKGWKMPPNTVYVGRPTKWGNWLVARKAEYARTVGGVKYGWVVFNLKTDAPAIYCDTKKGAIKNCVYWYRHHAPRLVPDIDKLRGKNLACWCNPDDPCHADVLLDMANEYCQWDGISAANSNLHRLARNND